MPKSRRRKKPVQRRRQPQPRLTVKEMEKAEYTPVDPVVSTVAEGDSLPTAEGDLGAPSPQDQKILEEGYEQEEVIENDPEPEVVLSPREQIYKTYQDKMNAQQDEGDLDLEPEPEDEDDVVPDEAPAAPAPAEPQQPATGYVQVTVDGRTYLADAAKVEAAGGVELYQKTASVNSKFQENSHRATRLTEWENQLAERERLLKEQAPTKKTSQVPQQPVPAAQPNGDDSVELLQGIKAFRESITDGNDNAADQELFKLLLAARQSNQAPVQQTQEVAPPDINAITQQAAQIVRQETIQEANERLTHSFLDQHPEILKDPRLFTLVDNETDVVAKENPNFGLDQIYEESLKRVNSWRGVNGSGPGVSTPQPKPNGAGDKIAQKRSAAPVSRAGRSQAPPPVKRQTNSEYVQSLRKQRGLE